MIKKILKKYNCWKLGKKLLVIFVLVSILPILFVQGFAFYMNREKMTEKIDELMVNNLTQIAERVDLNMEVYTNLIYQIYKDQVIIDCIQKISRDQDSGEKAVGYNQIMNRLKQYSDRASSIRCISVVCPDGSSVFYDFETDSSVNTIWQGNEDMRNTLPYQEAVDKPGMVVTDTMRFPEESTAYFHISKRMFDFNNLEKGSIATVIMTISERALNEICKNPGDMQDKSINFIVNKNRQVISYPDKEFAGISINPKLKTEEFVKVSGYLRERNTGINEYEDSMTGWIFCNAYDKDYMLKDISDTQRILVFASAAVLIFAVFLIAYTVKSLDASVNSVVSGIQEVQKGNLNVVVPVRSSDEIGVIADNFNSMTVKVKELICQVGAAKEKQKNAEIRALEAQINPHFLYNTLDSINWLAIEKEEYEISKMLRNLGIILRYSINKSNQMVTVQEMCDWLEKYVSLQEMRFDNVFSYEGNVESDAYGVKVYKLLLQPFVENAIIHGFKEIDGGGILRVDIFMTEDKKGITIIIEDNGKGMMPDMVKCFNNRETAIQDDGCSIGLHNAFSRMNMYYGEAATWNVSSIPDMGTVVTLRLPVLEEE